MNSKNKNPRSAKTSIGNMLLIVGGALMGLTFGWTTYGYLSNEIPTLTNPKQVQQGYVIPNKLEIEVQNLDENEKYEVLMRYDGKPYLLKLDEQGNPAVQPYEIKSSE